MDANQDGTPEPKVPGRVDAPDAVRGPAVCGQPSLFGDLPRTERGGSTAKRVRAMVRRGERKPTPPASMAGDVSMGDGPAPPPSAATVATIVVETVPAPFDPAALSQAELRGLVSGLPDHKLTFLLTEAARELKRRIVPDGSMDVAEADATPRAPDQGLLRVARAVVGELSGEDDFGGGYEDDFGGGNRKAAAARGRGVHRGRYAA